MTVLGLRFCARAFSSCGKRGPLFIAVRGPLTVAASLVAEHRLQTRRLSNCGSWAQLLRGMWDLPRRGLEPVSPALAGRFSTTAPPGKPISYFFNLSFLLFLIFLFQKELFSPLGKLYMIFNMSYFKSFYYTPSCIQSMYIQRVPTMCKAMCFVCEDE